MPNHIPVTVGTNRYNNVRDAWRVESPDDLPEITVRKRLAAGWDTWPAFKWPPVAPKLRRTNKAYRMS